MRVLGFTAAIIGNSILLTCWMRVLDWNCEPADVAIRYNLN